MNRAKYYYNILDRLSHLTTKIDMLGERNILNLHLHAENFYLHFLNELFGWQLENLNTAKPNAEAIDLIDYKNKIIVQVSATATKEKVQSALRKDLSIYPGYLFKFISISKDASALRTKNFVTPSSLSFDPQADIYDIPSILKLIFGFAVDDLHRIADFIERELGEDRELSPHRESPHPGGWELDKGEAKNLRKLVEMVYIVLRCDQISNADPFLPTISEKLPQYEGCWGKSLVGIAKPLFDYDTSDFFRWQGGITTGVLAANALFDFERNYLNRNPHQLTYLKKYKYSLLKMQDHTGGFGGIVKERASFAPKPSLRHTASVFSFLRKLHPPALSLKLGHKYLAPFIDDVLSGEEVHDTSSQALALSWLFRTMTDLAEQGEIQIELVPCQKQVLNRLACLDGQFYPSWKPYGWRYDNQSQNGKVWTALTVLKICPEIVGHDLGSERVKHLLQEIMCLKTGDGLRIHDGEPVADIGMTALLAHTLEKMAPFDGFSVVSFNADDIWKLVLMQNDKFCHYRNVWAETLYPILSLGIRFKDFLKKSDITQLDAIVSTITGGNWCNGEVVVGEAEAEDYPLLRPLLEQILERYDLSRISHTS